MAPSSCATSPFSFSCALFAWSELCTARSISTWSLSTSHISCRSSSCCRLGSYCRLYLRCSTSISSISNRIRFLHCSSSVSLLASFERSNVSSDLSVFSCCRTSSLSSSTYWYASSCSPVCRYSASVLLISCVIVSSWSTSRSRPRLSR
uniref:Putative secreted peptide n=1 Tax=Anopheles braziliensis TaxID=58242 RepID=A0A2M3ZQW1_9DIPT